MSTPRPNLSMTEFIALIGMMFATVAFSIDAMLPALTIIGDELSPGDPNQAQLVVTSFVFGMGLGTLVAGPLSDAYGRRVIIVAGSVLYVAAAFLAYWAQSLELLLAARVIQGLGASAPRIVSLAVVRDLYEGRRMAKIMSFAMIIFTIAPALAPTMGAMIIGGFGWRAIFLAFVLFIFISTGWFWVRQPETLAPDQRRPFRFGPILAALREMLDHPAVRLSILVQSLSFGMLFSMLVSVQPIYDVHFGRADTFHLWFGVVAVIAGSSAVLNAVLVEKLGMRFMVTAMLATQIVLTSGVIVAFNMPLTDSAAFGVFVFWQIAVFFQAGLTIGNLNAMAMEPMGHIAGLAASVIGSVATIAAVGLAIPVGLAFDGSPLPLAVGILIMGVLALALMLYMRRVEQRQT